MKRLRKKALGMSLVELLIGAGIFVMVIGISTSSGIMIYKGRAKIQYTNELYSETQFLMERIIQSARNNTIDYAEYFSQNDYQQKGNLPTSTEYGENPGLYEMFFYSIPNTHEDKNNVSKSGFSWKANDRSSDINVGIFNTNADSESNNDTGKSSEDEYTLPKAEYFSSFDEGVDQGLYFISADGKEKTIFRYAFQEEDRDAGKKEFGRIELLKMVLVKNTENEDKYEWRNHPDFPDLNDGRLGFISVTPPNITVTKFHFILSPFDDPHKSYDRPVLNGKTVHIQPHTIIQISARLNNENARATLGKNNEFSLQSSASSRVFTNVVFPRD